MPELLLVLLFGVFFLTMWVVSGHGIWCLVAAIVRRDPPAADSQDFDVEKDLAAATRLIELASFKGWIETSEYAELRSKLLQLRDRIESPTRTQLPETTRTSPKHSQPPAVVSTVTLVEEQPTTPTFQHPLEQDYADQTVTSQPIEAIPPREATTVSNRSVPKPKSVVQPESVTQPESSRLQERTPKYSTGDLIRSFMERSNIRWIELISAALIVCCSVGLVISLWNTLSQTHRLVPSIAFLLASVGVHGAGQYTLRRWKLRQTSRGILHVALMLIPLSVLVSVLLVSRSETHLVWDAITTTTLTLAALAYMALASTAARALHGRHWRQLCGLSIVPAFAVVLIHWIGHRAVAYDYIVGGFAFAAMLAVVFDCKLSSLTSLQKPSAASRRTLIRHFALLIHASYATALVVVFAIVQWDESARLWQTLQLCLGILCVTSLLWCWQLLTDGFSLVRESLSSTAAQPATLVRRLTVTKSLFEVAAWLIGFTSGALFLYCTWEVTDQRPLFLGMLYTATAAAFYSGLKFANRNILRFAATSVGIAVAVTFAIPLEHNMLGAEEVVGLRAIEFWTGSPFILSLTFTGLILALAPQLHLLASDKSSVRVNALGSALRFSAVVCFAWCTAVTALLSALPWFEETWHSILLLIYTSTAIAYLTIADCRSAESPKPWRSGVMWLTGPLAVVSVSRLAVHIPENVVTWLGADVKWPLAWLTLAIAWSLLTCLLRTISAVKNDSGLVAGLQLGALGLSLAATVQLCTAIPSLFPVVCLGWVLPLVMMCSYLHIASKTLANLASLTLIAWADVVCWHCLHRFELYDSLGFVGTVSILSAVTLGLCLLAEWILGRSSRLKENSFVLPAVLPVSSFLSLTCLAAIALPMFVAVGSNKVTESPLTFVSNLAVVATFINFASQIISAWLCRPHQRNFTDPFLRLLIPLNLTAIVIASTGAVAGTIACTWILAGLCLLSGICVSWKSPGDDADLSRLKLLYLPSVSLLFVGSAVCFLSGLTCAVEGPTSNFYWDTFLWSFPTVALLTLQTAKAPTTEQRTWSTYGLAAVVPLVIWLITLNQLSPGRPFWVSSMIPGLLFLFIEICATLGCTLTIKRFFDSTAKSNVSSDSSNTALQLNLLFSVFLVANSLLALSTILFSVAAPMEQLTNDLHSVYCSLWIPFLCFLAVVVYTPKNTRFDASYVTKVATPLIPLLAVWISQTSPNSGWFSYRLANGLFLIESIALVALSVRSVDHRPAPHLYGLLGTTLALTSFSIYSDPVEQWPLGMLQAIILVLIASSFLRRDNLAIHAAGVLAGVFLFLLLRFIDVGPIEAMVFSMYGPALVSLTYLVGPQLIKLMSSKSGTLATPRFTLHRSTTFSISGACLAITFGELLVYQTLIDSRFLFAGIPLVAIVLSSLAFFFPHDLGLPRVGAERLRGTSLFIALSTFNLVATFKICLASGLERDTTFVICIASQSLLNLGLAMLLREIGNYGTRDLVQLFGSASDRVSTSARDAFVWLRGFNFGFGVFASFLCASLVLTSDVAMVRRIASLLPLLASISHVLLRKEGPQHAFTIWTLLSSSLMFSLATLPYPLSAIPYTDSWAPFQRILATTIGLSWLVALIDGRFKLFETVRLKPLNALTTTTAFVCGILLPIVANSTDSSLPESSLFTKLAVLALLGLLGARLSVVVFQTREIDQTLDLPQRQFLVALCQAIVVSISLTTWLCFPDMFSGWFIRWWPIAALAISALLLAFAGAFTSPIAKQLLKPVQVTGMVIPAGTVALSWMLAATKDGPIALWGEPRLMSVLLLLVALLYGWCAIRQTAVFLGVLSALSLLGSFWCALASQPDLAFFKHPQFWLLPPAALALVFTEWNRNKLAASVVTATRYFCALLIYFSSTAEMLLGTFDGRIWPPIVLLAVSLLGVFAGISMRIRAFLYCSTSFVLVAVLGMVWQAQRAIEQSWPWWTFGIIVGAGLIAGLGYIEKNRDKFNSYIKSLESWEA